MVFKTALEGGARNDWQKESARIGFPFTLHGKKLSPIVGHTRQTHHS